MTKYVRSVLVRFAGAMAGAAIWLGLIVLALANFDQPVGFVEDLEATWVFWVIALAIVFIVLFALRRAEPGPSWGSFAIGFIAPLIGLILNANVGSGGGWWFWLPVLALVFVPRPGTRRPA